MVPGDPAPIAENSQSMLIQSTLLPTLSNRADASASDDDSPPENMLFQSSSKTPGQPSERYRSCHISRCCIRRMTRFRNHSEADSGRADSTPDMTSTQVQSYSSDAPTVQVRRLTILDGHVSDDQAQDSRIVHYHLSIYQTRACELDSPSCFSVGRILNIRDNGWPGWMVYKSVLLSNKLHTVERTSTSALRERPESTE